MSRPQFSLAALLTVVTALAIALAFWRPVWNAGRNIQWSDPSLAWWLVAIGWLCVTAVLLVRYGRR